MLPSPKKRLPRPSLLRGNLYDPPWTHGVSERARSRLPWLPFTARSGAGAPRPPCWSRSGVGVGGRPRRQGCLRRGGGRLNARMPGLGGPRWTHGKGGVREDAPGDGRMRGPWSAVRTGGGSACDPVRSHRGVPAVYGAHA